MQGLWTFVSCLRSDFIIFLASLVHVGHLCDLQGNWQKSTICTQWITFNCNYIMLMWHHDVVMSHGDGCLQTWKKTSLRNSVFANTSNLSLIVYHESGFIWFEMCVTLISHIIQILIFIHFSNTKWAHVHMGLFVIHSTQLYFHMSDKNRH